MPFLIYHVSHVLDSFPPLRGGIEGGEVLPENIKKEMSKAQVLIIHWQND